MFFSHPIDPLRTQILRQFWWEKTDATSFSPINFGGFRGAIDPLEPWQLLLPFLGTNPWPPTEVCQTFARLIEAPGDLSIQIRRPPWISGWWQLKYFLFPPLPGEDEPILTHIFSIGLKPPTRFPKLVTFPSSVGGHFRLGLNDSSSCLWMPGASWSTGTDARRGWGPNCSYKLFCFTLARN